MERKEISNLEGLLNEFKEAGAGNDSVSVGDIYHRLGRRSFGPMLFFAGLPSMTPIATVPGLPTVLAVIIMLTAIQMLIGLPRLWLPQAILRRSINRDRFVRALDVVRPAARGIDKLIGPRLTFMTEWPFIYLIAVCCCLLALTMPPLEFIPFTGGIPAFPVALFGLGLTVHDGLLVLLALLTIAAGLTAIVVFGPALLDSVTF